jgi:hypothetical protein
MTQHTVSHTRSAPKRRPGARVKSSCSVPVALVVLSLIPVISGSGCWMTLLYHGAPGGHVLSGIRARHALAHAPLAGS